MCVCVWCVCVCLYIYNEWNAQVLSATDARRGDKLDRQLGQLEHDLSLALPQSALERQVKALESLAAIASSHLQVCDMTISYA